MKLRGSHLVALLIMGAIGGWMFTGELIVGGQVDPNAPTIAEREANRTSEAFRVRVETVQPTERQSTLTLQGRTEVETRVSVRAETGGTVEKRLVDKGQMIQPGDVLCEIDPGVRNVSLAQAEAQLSQAREDYLAAQKLVERGYATRSRLRALQTALNAAEASAASMKQDMGRTQIRATVSGIVQDPMAEAGDNLTPGGVCVTLIDPNPMLFTGQVSERDISALSVGMQSDVRVVGGNSVAGEIRYIAPAADPSTRTFEIEIELPNGDGALRDGMTAVADIPLKPTLAYEIFSSWLTLADDGSVGVRAIDANNKVAFHPVQILAHGAETMWVSGLRPGLSVITLGQNFVIAGETVEPVTAEQMKRLESAGVANSNGTVKQ